MRHEVPFKNLYYNFTIVILTVRLMAAEKLRETCDADGHLGDTSVLRQF